jgi:LIVCS family branched-chain amino acid:cation transporter
MSGKQWFLGFLCFIVADAGLAIMTVLAMIRQDGSIQTLFSRLGKVPSKLIVILTMFIVGPALCIPRTCATTFEMGVLPFFPGFSPWIFGAVFFGIIFLLIVRRAKVVDIIGKYMTPILLISLAALVIRGVVTPVGQIQGSIDAITAAKEGFLAGYQTMDVLGALAFSLIVIRDVRVKGYNTHKSSMAIVLRASLVTFIGLFLVYGGLCYLGATSSSLDLGDFNQTSLLVTITQRLLCSFGMVLLAVIVLLACLTTAVGLASSSGDFFYQLIKKKIPYKWIVGISCVLGVIISNVGISAMITLATPMLNVLYPLLLSQIILSFFSGKIRKDSVFQGAALATLIVCILGVAADFGASTDFVHHLPLSSLGLYWILPAGIGAALGALVPTKK